MSDMNEQSAISQELKTTLTRYDESRNPELLEEASDQISRDDGSVPAEPEQAKSIGEHRMALWCDLLHRFKRDLDASFDPDNAPTLQVMPPPVGGEQLPPGVPPSSISDPELRKKYEQDIAKNKKRLGSFAVQNKLHEAHMAVIDRATASIGDAHEKLGLTAEEIASALAKADILAGDRAALLKAVHS